VAKDNMLADEGAKIQRSNTIITAVASRVETVWSVVAMVRLSLSK
jgi:hypothetical protein